MSWGWGHGRSYGCINIFLFLFTTQWMKVKFGDQQHILWIWRKEQVDEIRDKDICWYEWFKWVSLRIYSKATHMSISSVRVISCHRGHMNFQIWVRSTGNVLTKSYMIVVETTFQEEGSIYNNEVLNCSQAMTYLLRTNNLVHI